MRDWRGAVRERLAPLGLDPHQEVDLVEELALELEERRARAVREGHTAAAADALVSRELAADAFSAEIQAALRTPAPRPAPDASLTPTRAGVLGGWGEDLRYAARLLVKNPLFTAAAVVSLGLGVGANTTIFTIVNAVLLNPLPVREPSRLVSIYTQDAKNQARFQGFMPVSYRNFRDYQEQAGHVL